MIFVYFFLPLLSFFYLTLRGLARLDLKIPLLTLSLVCTLITLFIYKELGGAVNFSLVIDQEILSRFIANESKNKEKDAIEVNRIIFELSNKKEAQAGEIYLLARRLKDINQNELASLAFAQLYRNFKNELGGAVLAEYAQVMFLNEQRTFNTEIEKVLKEALLKSPDNPSALTLQGLKELENKNADLTIKLWTRALDSLENKRDISELKILIETVKKLKNQ